MAACVVSGVIKDVTETAIVGAIVRANLVNPVFVGTVLIVPKETTTTTAAGGTWSLSLSQSTSYIVTIDYPPNALDSARRYSYAIITPASSTANFSTLAIEA